MRKILFGLLVLTPSLAEAQDVWVRQSFRHRESRRDSYRAATAFYGQPGVLFLGQPGVQVYTLQPPSLIVFQPTVEVREVRVVPTTTYRTEIRTTTYGPHQP